MKNLFVLLVIFLSIWHIEAQTPQKMSYQAVIRDANGQLMKNRNIGMQVSVLQGSANGTVVFAERFFPTTNENGLVTVEIGGGLSVNGSFAAIDWKTGPFFIKTETDINGGANYTLSATSQLLSVPYALLAKNVENVPSLKMDDLTDVDAANIQPGQLLKWDGSNWKPANDATGGSGGSGYTAGPGISISTNNIIANTGDNDNNPDNELQKLTLSGTVLTLSQNGGSVTLPGTGGGGDNWGTQNVVTNPSLSGNGTQTNPLEIAEGGVTPSKLSETGANHNDALIFDANTNNWVLRKPVNIQEGSGIQVIPTSNGPLNYVINAQDTSPENELQTLTLVGQNLSLSKGGGTVILSNAGDQWGNQTVATNGTLTGNGTNNNPLSISTNGVNSSHILNNTIKPEDLSETGVPLFSVLKFVGDATTGGNWQYSPGMTILAGQGIQVNPVVPSADGAVRISSSSSWNSVGGTVSTPDKVGIGISPASANLHVIGDLRVTPNLNNKVPIYASTNGAEIQIIGVPQEDFAAIIAENTSLGGQNAFPIAIKAIAPQNAVGNSFGLVSSAKIGIQTLGDVSGIESFSSSGIAVKGRTFNGLAGDFLGRVNFEHSNPNPVIYSKATGNSNNSVAIWGEASGGPLSTAIYGKQYLGGEAIFGDNNDSNTSGFAGFFRGRTKITQNLYVLGKTGVKTEEPTADLDIDGSLRVRKISNGPGTDDLRTDMNGNIFKSSSDLRLKKNIRNIDGALNKVIKTRPVLFDWKDNPSAINQYGFIAQEINKIIPEIVNHDQETDLYSIDYSELIPVLTKAIQEQQVMIDHLKAENEALKQVMKEEMAAIRALISKSDSLAKNE